MIFISPIKVLAGKVKKFVLNLNQYRNTHYRVLNTCKIHYKENMKEQIERAKKFDRVLCIYTVYQPSNRHFDLGNVCCIHEKFFEDALVELGRLEDDNSRFIPLVIYKNGHVDKDNPRVEIEVLEFNQESIDKVVDMLYNMVREEG